MVTRIWRGLSRFGDRARLPHAYPHRWRNVCGGGALVLSLLGLAAPARLTLTADPLSAHAPAGLTIRVHVTPASTYQHVTVVIDGEHYSSMSDEDVEPDRPYWFYRQVPRLPPGDYQVTAILTSHSAPVVRKVTVVRH